MKWIGFLFILMIYINFLPLYVIGRLFPAFKKTHYYVVSSVFFSTWCYGDRYYQTFKILPHIPKTKKLLYVGIRPYQVWSLKYNFSDFENIFFMDIEDDVQKCCFGKPFVAGNLASVDNYFTENQFDYVVVLGIFFTMAWGKIFWSRVPMPF